ncbi:MAG TPA: hypothetical protein VFA06_03105 [Actinocrinis sp.]|uniref:hypothetical protein n=1 Tax=Actinocrinis sp. TaxID=1920516 RepID=UPI002D55331D|nr:hypothetical protein [Actinocrinis sp.]HZU54837.1 hypothetical protein [Actinocrinis sp.]
MNRNILAASAAALLAAVAACSSTASPTATASSPPSASASPSGTNSSPSPSPSPSGSAAPALGTEQTFADAGDGVTIKVTATSYRVVTLSTENQELAKAGTKVALVGVRMCVTADKSGNGVGLTWSPLSVLTAAGAAYTPPSAYGTQDWPGPLYPNDANLTYHAGTCRSGLIPFLFTGADQPVMVEYNAQGGVYDWRLS